MLFLKSEFCLGSEIRYQDCNSVFTLPDSAMISRVSVSWLQVCVSRVSFYVSVIRVQGIRTRV